MIQSLVPLEFLRIDVLRLEYMNTLDPNVLMARSPNDPFDRSRVPRALMMAIDEIQRLRDATIVAWMCNILPPGKASAVHTDPEPHGRLERWHLPIITNRQALWFDESSGARHLEAGWWHGPMPYWRLHQVSNGGAEARCHLVVDALPRV